MLTPSEFLTELELQIDYRGLDVVLAELSLVCGEKAEHVRHNWQDNTLAAIWANADRALDKLAHSKTVQQVPLTR